MTIARGTKGVLSFSGAVVSALCGLIVTVQASIDPDAPGEPVAKYAPGILIVKYKESVADELKAALVRGESLQEVATIASLDALNAKHGLKDMRMLFPSFQLKDADGRVIHVETAQEHVDRIREKFPIRARRAPAVYIGPDLTTVFKLEVDQKANMEEVAEEYSADPAVEYAHPDGFVQACWQPNDYFYNHSNSWGQGYDDLWGLKKVRCGEAWDLSRGSGTVIAVIDSGIWYRVVPEMPYYSGHPDIVSNLWINYYEYYYGHPGYDDDGNGKVDDSWG